MIDDNGLVIITSTCIGTFFARKPVFAVCLQFPHKQGCTHTDHCYRLELFVFICTCGWIVVSMKQ